MEVLTLLRANIRHKKGSFVSIIILMMIVSLAFTAIISVRDNCVESTEAALERANAGSLALFIEKKNLSDALLDSVKNHPAVKDVTFKEAVKSLGATFGEIEDGNPWMMTRLTPKDSLLNEDASGYANHTPALKSGEMYISQGLGTKMGCDIGDTLLISTLTGEREFLVKGFIVEPLCGSMNMGYKIVFISDEDFAQLQQDALTKNPNNLDVDYRVLQIHKADESLSDSQFKRQLNLDTGIIDHALGTLSRTQTIEYTNIYPDIISNVLMIFVVFLVAIVLIVMAHSISTSIEMEYTSLGVLKAQGFTERKIRMVFSAQYLVAQLVGALLGMVAALPLIHFLGGIFQPILSIPCQNGVSIVASILFVLAILALSAIFIWIITRKVGKISPMKAISGGKDDIYFGSRLNAPISQKALSTSLAFRQFTSHKRRYISSILIIAILMFFMITMNVLGSSVDSKSSMEAMGMYYADISIQYRDSISDSQEQEIEATIEKHADIHKKYRISNMYMSLNGDEYCCVVYQNPEVMIMEEGRYPRYDNEIAITDFIAKELNLDIGDKVTVANKSYQAEFIITGINVYGNDLGLNFSMPLVAAQKLGVEDVYYSAYSLEDASASSAIVAEINEKFADIAIAEEISAGSSLDLYSLARNAITAVIYVISMVFSLVVVMMFCKKAFLQERRDIGIYKSLGFTSNKLRLQFAIRFLIVSLIGSALGAVLSLFFAEPVLKAVFRTFGVSGLNAKFTPSSFIFPIVIIAASFFSFAYLASRKIKTVEIKELVIE